ncbi:WG repeat-containing protein [Massilia sp. CCM 8734]|uniref:WG repeat-containing protein n=1 Tax=Massilia sp. CCM 8734 TaxID=2609283 RepID=UPI001E379EBC|nr:WG repeat-containing protein [Massilia sp. CCM 8734]
MLAYFEDDGHGGGIAAAQAADGSFGYVDTRGAWIVAPTLDKARAFGDNGLARYCREGRWGYLDVRGQTVIAPRYEDAQAFSQGLAAVQTGANKWIYIDVGGNPAFECAFRSAGPFTDTGLAVASTKRDLFGYIDNTGAWAIAPRFERALAFGAQGVAPASEDGKLFGLIDRRGNWILQPCHRRIDPFNEEGLAYCEEAGQEWYDGGYINVRGEHIIRNRRRLSPVMSHGIAVEDDSGYVTAQGTLDAGLYVSWAQTFNDSGFAVARCSGMVQTPQGPVDAKSRWGIMRSDGSFALPPADVLEPVTGDDRMVVPAELDTPLAAFLASDESVALLDRDARVAYRMCKSGGPQSWHATLHDAAGALLWQGAPHPALRVPSLFFHLDADAPLDQLDSADHLIPFAQALMGETERKLHDIATLLHAIDDDDAENDDDEDEDEGDDDDLDPAQKLARLVGTTRRIYHAYLDANVNATFDFLCFDREEMADAMYSRCMALLDAHFGPADPDPDFPPGSTGEDWPAWQVALRRPLAGPGSARPESNQLWLAIDLESDNGDGDVWHIIRLTCSPSKETLEAALAGRQPAAPVAAEPDPAPQTAQEWFARSYGAKHAIRNMPRDLIDADVADFAVDLGADAFAELPPHLQTPARLERVIRQSAEQAADVPGYCMTADALALARSLYGDDEDWCRSDKRNSQVPTTFDAYCLDEVWGCLVDQQFCLHALSADACLGSVPLWLRSEEMYTGASFGYSDNLRYIPRASITPEMVWRIRASDLGTIPETLLTPEVCQFRTWEDPMALAFLPEALRTPALCRTAVKNDTQALCGVPDALKEAICSQLIAEHAGPGTNEERACRWHALRAWTRLWKRDWDGAIGDALLAIKHVDDPAHMHYVLASAYRASGQPLPAAREAAKVLALWDVYEPEFGDKTDAQWLPSIAHTAFNEASEAELLEELYANPLVLSQIPGRRITAAMVDVAVGADSNAVAHVPKRLMTAALYALAVRTHNKHESRVPPAFRKGA